MTRSQASRLTAGDYVFRAEMLARVLDPPLIRRRTGLRVRVAHLRASDVAIEAAPAELRAFGKVRRLSPANKALLDRLAAIVRRSA